MDRKIGRVMLAHEVEQFYAHNAGGLSPEQRRSLADAVKVIRGDTDEPVESGGPEGVAGTVASLLDLERDGSAFTDPGDADGPPWVDTVEDLEDGCLRVACTDGRVYLVGVEEVE